MYLGDDDNGRKVAVKKLSSVSMGTTSDEESQRRMRREFETEVNIISRLRHKNLVRLFGWCDDRSNGLHLVYEYISGGNLHDLLHRPRPGTGTTTPLSWNDRYTPI